MFAHSRLSHHSGLGWVLYFVAVMLCKEQADSNQQQANVCWTLLVVMVGVCMDI